MEVVESDDTFCYTKLDYVCRSCLRRGMKVATEYIFKKDSILFYTACTNIQVDKRDGLPQYLCKDCYDKLQDYYRFKERCLESYTILLKEVKGIHSLKVDDSDYMHLNTSTISDEFPDNEFKIEVDAPFKEEELESKDDTSNQEPITDEMGLNVDSDGSIVEDTKIMFQIDLTESTDEDSGKTKFSCRICSAEVKRGNMKKHLESHGTYCKICDKSFRSLAHFDTHNKKNYVLCQVCGKSVANGYYMLHLKRHNKQKDFACKTCGQKFYGKSLLENHILDRHKGRKFICDYCSKEFITKHAIITHVYRHQAPRFKCNYCDKAYRSHWVLSIHKRKHTGFLPYKCDYCQRGFARKCGMEKHRVMHTGEKPFVCERCNYAYAHKVSLRRHLKKCTGKSSSKD